MYVLSNPAMPGLIKIGKTSQQEVKERMRQLYTTGVPLPFNCEYACRVTNCAQVESALHLAFGNSRINSSREFFQIEPERVIAVLKLLAVANVTPQIEGYLSENVSIEEKAAADKLKSSRRPPMNFVEMGIPIGSTLFYKEGDTQVTVVEEKKILFNGNVCSLTAATREIMGLEYSVQPAAHWSFQGRSLREIYNETYANSSDDM